MKIAAIGKNLYFNSAIIYESKDICMKLTAYLNPLLLQFDDAAPKSAFETAYVNGAVPCRYMHFICVFLKAVPSLID